MSDDSDFEVESFLRSVNADLSKAISNLNQGTKTTTKKPKTTNRKRKIDKENKKDKEIIEILSPSEKKKKQNLEMSIYDQRHHQFDVNVSNSGNFLPKTSSTRSEEQPQSTVLQHSLAPLVPDCSIATLCNIGNTCYLNAVIYTLRYAPSFLHKIHHLIEDLSQINQKIVQNRIKSSSLGRNVAGIQGQSGRSWSSKDLASLGNLTISADVPKLKAQVKLLNFFFIIDDFKFFLIFTDCH